MSQTRNHSNMLVYDGDDDEYQKSEMNNESTKQTSNSSNLIYVKKKIQESSEMQQSQISQYNLQSPVKLISTKKVKASTFVFEESEQQEPNNDYSTNKVTETTKGGQTIQYSEQWQGKNMIPKMQPQLSTTRKLNRSDSASQQEQMVQKIQQRVQESQEESYEDDSDQRDSVNTSGVPIAMLKTNIDKLVFLPIPEGFQITCYIKIQSILLGLKNIFNLYLKDNEALILSAKKQVMSFVSNYNISKTKTNHSKRNQNFVCSLKSNFSGTEWKMYENQEQTMRIFYKQTVFGYLSIRSMNIVKVDPEAKVQKKIIPPLENILKKPKTKQRHIIDLKTRQPEKVNGKYKVDFHGLAKIPSGKNFIICQNIDKKEKECLLFAKQKQNLFLLQVKYPFTILEAFSICLTSLDGKILVN